MRYAGANGTHATGRQRVLGGCRYPLSITTDPPHVSSGRYPGSPGRPLDGQCRRCGRRPPSRPEAETAHRSADAVLEPNTRMAFIDLDRAWRRWSASSSSNCPVPVGLKPCLAWRRGPAGNRASASATTAATFFSLAVPARRAASSGSRLGLEGGAGAASHSTPGHTGGTATSKESASRIFAAYSLAIDAACAGFCAGGW